MTAAADASNLSLDDHVDLEIADCLNLDKPLSFFLFAGAGSGKTRSLVNGLIHIQSKFGVELRLRGQRVAVITYTNAARDEIISRLKADALFHVATIHSFAWTLIQGYNKDIREFLRASIKERIVEVEAAEAKGRSGTKASADRIAQIESHKRRLGRLDELRKFTYNPNGDNRESTSLNHTEVIAIAAKFIGEKPTMQSILTQRYPFLLVDESQDTNKALVEAFLVVEAASRGKFALGFFGDMMQRIYNDGKEDFEKVIPGPWAKPEKKLNFRCPKRVLRLINKIRSEADAHQQVAADTSAEGKVRLFLLAADTPDKPAAEVNIREKMAEIVDDIDWKARENCKILTLEHHMAAMRMGFSNIFAALAEVDEYRTGLLDGTLPPVRIFSNNILKVVQAEKAGDKFASARVVRENSPLISAQTLQASENPQANIAAARDGVASLMALFANAEPSCGAVLANIANTKLFDIPESLIPVLEARLNPDGAAPPPDAGAGEDVDTRMTALNAFLDTSFAEVGPYAQYVSGLAPYDTHQGVKGREFERVMVLVDDAEQRGFLFGYEKLFGAKELSATDLKHKAEGRENAVDRTRRLLYVTCSRAKRSLALVVYTANPTAVRDQVIGTGWFLPDEVVVI